MSLSVISSHRCLEKGRKSLCPYQCIIHPQSAFDLARAASVFFPAGCPLHLEHVHGELLGDLAEAVVAGHAHVGGALSPRGHGLVDVAVEAPLVHQVARFTQDVTAGQRQMNASRY